MAISDRISAMYDHVEDIYDTMALGGDTTSNKNIVNINTEIKREYKDFLANGTDTLWNNWEKVNGTGETLSLSPTIKGKMNIDLKGNAQQNGEPTPDTPIPVQVVSGNNSIEASNRNIWDEVWEQGYIYYNPDNSNWGTNASSTTQIRSKNYIPVDTSKTYYSSYTGNQNYSLIVIMYDKDKNPIESGNEGYIVGKNTILNLEPNTKYIRFYVSSGYGGTYLNDICINVSDSKNGTYTQHKGASYPINLGNIELCKIGTYQDSIVKDNGKWYLNKQIGKGVLDGSETITIFIQQQNRTIFAISGKTNDIETYNFSTLIPSILSSHFKPTSQTSAWVVGDISRRKEEQTTIYLVYEPNTTIEDFQTWLSTHNTEVYYVLATPTYEEITDTTLLSQLEALAYSYEGTTNISQENDDLASELDVVALQEM